MDIAKEVFKGKYIAKGKKKSCEFKVNLLEFPI